MLLRLDLNRSTVFATQIVGRSGDSPVETLRDRDRVAIANKSVGANIY